MIPQNLHTHTIFDDGTATVMDMAQAALNAGLTSLGFSGHSTLPYRDNWEIKPGRMPDYLAAVAEAKEVFRGRLAIYSGLELDSTSVLPEEPLDYVIGSIHHIVKDGQYLSIDYKPAISRDILDVHFRGDRDAMAAAYFAQYDAIAQNPRVDIVGHFDLLSKFDEAAGLFDSSAPAYRDAAMAAMETLLRADKIFEVNTGAMSRGYRTAPYPDKFLLRELKARGGRVLVTSDSHATTTITRAFDTVEDLLVSIGFKEIWVLGENDFVPWKIG